MLGLLSSAGFPISGEVNIAVAIFVLPLNSALNPFLHTLNTLMEMRRKSGELKLIKRLEEHICSQESYKTNRKSVQRNEQRLGNKTYLAIEFLCKSLASKKTTLEDVNACLFEHNAEMKLIKLTEGYNECTLN